MSRETIGERFASIDAIRGFAVCGILVMNIVSMGEPGYAYIDPTYYGGAKGWDLLAWCLAYVFADGKMRMLFTMLFGASLAITTDRAEHPALLHYPRMAWLLVFGMIHCWFFWYGDILVEYALIGMLLFVARKWPPLALFYAAAVLVLVETGLELSSAMYASQMQHAAELPGATQAARDAWAAVRNEMAPPTQIIAFELEKYRGSFLDAFAARVPMATMFQTQFLPVNLIGSTGIAAFGLGLYRAGFLTGAWRRQTYWALVGAGVIACVAYIPLVQLIITRSFDPVLLPITNNISLILRPLVALGYASTIILLLRAGKIRWLTVRLEAAGRMAFTNYLGTTLIATTLFYGYGFGLFGYLSRAELYIIVFAIWAFILLWSRIWLTRYRYGPLEWLWRSLARCQLQPMRADRHHAVIANQTQ